MRPEPGVRFRPRPSAARAVYAGVVRALVLGAAVGSTGCGAGPVGPARDAGLALQTDGPRYVLRRGAGVVFTGRMHGSDMAATRSSPGGTYRDTLRVWSGFPGTP